MDQTWTAGVPVLRRGRHRSPRKGACFMEYVSYLAGEPWSDHPDCTHPLLAVVAREVNDETSTTARPALAPLIPSVVGLTTDDPCLAPALVARCLRQVLPVVSELYQRTLAAAVLDAERYLAELEDRAPRTDCPPACHPGAWTWAEAYLAVNPQPRGADYADRLAPTALAGAIRAVTDFRAPEGDVLLYRILTEAIDECRIRSRVDHGAVLASTGVPSTG